ncbi:DMT family transporter [Roseateles violae]|uniref:DMT family transporter n=1 Tax=Roseateles violae TaxID=3058042 RepID=A0ABT8DQ52_9BURK|nr:DMT family transporter [Pelomonas sp. PFR6]MDN3920287.1 DMT family transporter [Pelomonas sp. PFR6]
MPARWVAAMPALFVAIWCTGFVVARLGMPHAPPITFLAIRFALSSACFGLWVLGSGAAWPDTPRQWAHLIVLGLLTHALYLICGWAAVKQGMGAGTMALIAGLQPLLTAVWLHGRGAERLRGLQWLGLLLGLAGLLLVVGRKLGQGELGALNLSLGIAALLAISIGSLHQKRFVGPCDARTAMLIQLLAATALSAALAPLEQEPLDWGPELAIALAWSVLALTLGGSSLLYLLLQQGAATRVASLMYLTPPCAALLAWALFDEGVGAQVWLGMGLSALGVFWVLRKP